MAKELKDYSFTELVEEIVRRDSHSSVGNVEVFLGIRQGDLCLISRKGKSGFEQIEIRFTADEIRDKPRAIFLSKGATSFDWTDLAGIHD